MKKINNDFHEIVKALVANDQKKLSEISDRRRFDPTFLPVYDDVISTFSNDDRSTFSKQTKQKPLTSRNNRFSL